MAEFGIFEHAEYYYYFCEAESEHTQVSSPRVKYASFSIGEAYAPKLHSQGL